MMSDPSSVDQTTFDELTGKLVLLIEESRPWHDAREMHRQLSAKVRHYVRHIRSESFAREHGQRPQDTIVRLVSAQPLPEDSLEFFQRISYELSKNGIDFEYQVGDETVPILVTPGAPAAPPPPPVTGQPAPPPVSRTDTEAPAAESPETEGVASFPETAEPGFEADLAAEIDEALEALEAGSPEPAEAEEIAETLESPEPGEPGKPKPAEPTGPAEAVPHEPTAKPRDAVPSFSKPERSGEGTSKKDDWEIDYPDEGPSELEMLIDAPDDVASRYIGLDEKPTAAAGPPAEPAEPLEPPEPPADAESTHPPFFPEEEFGRALPESDDFETLLRGADSEPLEPAIIETSSGKRIRLEVPGATSAERRAVGGEAGPSLKRAVGAAIGSAIAGAVIWAALAIPADQGASPLALAVALMVGMSVRLRGGGHTNSFRLVGCLGTIFGSALGALLATAALTGWSRGQGLEGVINLFIDPASLWVAIDATFDPIDLVSLVIALYLAYKISASRPAD